MADGVCDITGCDRPKVCEIHMENAETKVEVIHLELCQLHGEQMRRTYFPDAPAVTNPCAEIPISFEVSKK